MVIMFKMVKIIEGFPNNLHYNETKDNFAFVNLSIILSNQNLKSYVFNTEANI